MNIRSAKAKGRKLCLEVMDLLLKQAPELSADDIRVNPASCPGEDIWLSPAARKVFPLAIECKNQEKLNIWKAIEQARGYGKDGRVPVVVLSRNRFPEPYAIIALSDLIQITKVANCINKEKAKNNAN